MFYVYLHTNPTTGKPFYVGKGKGSRAYSLKGRNKFWHNIVAKHGKEVQIIHEGLSEQDAHKMETELILLYGRRDIGTGDLVNLTDGGEGVHGKVYTKKERKHHSKVMKQYYASDCARNKRSIIAQQVNARPEVKAKISKSMKLLNTNPLVLRKKRRNTKASWNNTDIRNKRTASIRSVRSTAESKNKTRLQAQKTYKGFISPTGEIYRNVTNLSVFCTTHGITKNGMYSVASGKLKQHKGWSRLL
jgi:hypothetical protein